VFFKNKWRPTLSACSVASRRTLWSPTRPTAIEPGKRRYNWVWYRNVAQNRLAELLSDARGRQRASLDPARTALSRVTTSSKMTDPSI
jgi:hypothetical protein